MNTPKTQKTIIWIILLWMGAFVFIPNLMVLITSFLTRSETDLIQFSLTISNYLKLKDPLYAKVLWHSLYMASIATFLCLCLGYPFALILSQAPKKWQPIYLFFVILPFWTNSLIRTYGLKMVLGTNGLLNKALLSIGIIETPLRLIYTEYAVMIGLVYILLPFMILPLYSSIEKVDPSLIEAARDLGASKLQIFIKILLPLTMPGIIAGCLLVLLPGLGMFYVADLLGGAKNILIGNIIKTQILNIRDWPLGAATSVAITTIMAMMIALYWWALQIFHKQPVEKS